MEFAVLEKLMLEDVRLPSSNNIDYCAKILFNYNQINDVKCKLYRDIYSLFNIDFGEPFNVKIIFDYKYDYNYVLYNTDSNTDSNNNTLNKEFEEYLGENFTNHITFIIDLESAYKLIQRSYYKAYTSFMIIKILFNLHEHHKFTNNLNNKLICVTFSKIIEIEEYIKDLKKQIPTFEDVFGYKKLSFDELYENNKDVVDFDFDPNFDFNPNFDLVDNNNNTSTSTSTNTPASN